MEEVEMSRKWLVLMAGFAFLSGGCADSGAGTKKPDVKAEFRGDAYNSGVFDTQGVPVLAGEKWKAALQNATLHSSPVIADNTLYIGSEEGSFYAIDAEEGAVLWETNTGGRIRSTAAIHGDEVYYLDDTSTLYALNRASGEPLWSAKLNDVFVGTSLIDQWDYYIASPAVTEDTIYIGSEGIYFYALNRSDGTERWTFKTGAPVHGKAVLADGLVYVADRMGVVYALDQATGKEQWRNEDAGVVQSSLAYWDRTLYYGSRDTKVHAIDAATGKQIWEHASPGGSWVGSSAAVSESFVAIGASDSKVVHIFDQSSGVHLRDFPLESRVFASAVIVGDILYFGSAFTDDPNTGIDAFYAVELATGRELWRFEGTKAPILSSPVIENGVAYVAYMDGTIYALH
jgi:eukaryotic-like serine/threonine-protein kinase